MAFLREYPLHWSMARTRCQRIVQFYRRLTILSMNWTSHTCDCLPLWGFWFYRSQMDGRLSWPSWLITCLWCRLYLLTYLLCSGVGKETACRNLRSRRYDYTVCKVADTHRWHCHFWDSCQHTGRLWGPRFSHSLIITKSQIDLAKALNDPAHTARAAELRGVTDGRTDWQTFE